MQLTSQRPAIHFYTPALCRVVRLAIRAVDHLANSIEAMGTISKRTFEEALNIEFKVWCLWVYGRC
jgi:hypothetical protein